MFFDLPTINCITFAVDKYRSMTSEKIREAEKSQSSAPSVKSVNPFDNLDCKYEHPAMPVII
jgi:hypothetical protein